MAHVNPDTLADPGSESAGWYAVTPRKPKVTLPKLPTPPRGAIQTRYVITNEPDSAMRMAIYRAMRRNPHLSEADCRAMIVRRNGKRKHGGLTYKRKPARAGIPFELRKIAP